MFWSGRSLLFGLESALAFPRSSDDGACESDLRSKPTVPDEFVGTVARQDIVNRPERSSAANESIARMKTEIPDRSHGSAASINSPFTISSKSSE
jgi:hypothetical protein